MIRKVKHALITFTVSKEDGTTSFETAFRNQVVDIPDDQVERLDALGCTVAPDVDLSRPGAMVALPDSASNAEITNWVIGATNTEVEALVRERPAMAGRITAAHDSVAERFSEQNIHLGGLREIAEAAEVAAQEQADKDLLGLLSDEDLAVLIELTEDEVQGLAASAAAEAADLLGTAPEPVGFDELVKKTAKEVADFISENPGDAGEILDAEVRRAASSKEDPRVTIVRAAEAAAGFIQN